MRGRSSSPARRIGARASVLAFWSVLRADNGLAFTKAFTKVFTTRSERSGCVVNRSCFVSTICVELDSRTSNFTVDSPILSHGRPPAEPTAGGSGIPVANAALPHELVKQITDFRLLFARAWFKTWRFKVAGQPAAGLRLALPREARGARGAKEYASARTLLRSHPENRCEFPWEVRGCGLGKKKPPEVFGRLTEAYILSLLYKARGRDFPEESSSDLVRRSYSSVSRLELPVRV